MSSLGIKCEKNLAGHRSDGRFRELGVVEYTDSSYTGDIKDWKLITDHYFFLNGAIVTC